MKRIFVIAVAVFVFSPVHVRAAGLGGCEDFAWPLATELAWMNATDPIDVNSGAEIPSAPEKAIALALEPEADAKLMARASGKPKSVPERPFAGAVTIASIGKPGIYQVTLSSSGWIDVIQDGKVLDAVTHTGKSDCPSIRKSIRFDLKADPVMLQVTSVPANNVKIAIKAAD